MKGFVRRVSQKISKLTDEQVELLIETMNDENATMDSILESLSAGLVIVDEHFQILHTNKAAERFLPFTVHSNEHLEGETVWNVIDDADISEFLRDSAEQKKTNVSQEFSLTASDDKVRFVNVTVLPLVKKIKGKGSGVTEMSVTGSIITIHDITERRSQEVILHRMESLASLTNLAASVAHEIKNPLGAISIHIQLLQKAVKKCREGDGLLPDRKFMENYLDVINEEIDSLNKIVIDFLFAVRPVQAQLVLSKPDALLSKLADFFKPEFDSKGICVTMKLCNDGTRLLIDEKLFREVIVNITQNALQAISSRFNESYYQEDEERKQDDIPELKETGHLVIESFVKNDNYYLTIADNGCGMDEKTVSRIFEPYYTTKANGTGLGMTMVYKIIKEFNGDINVKSVVNHGTVFTLVIPIPQTATKLLPGVSD